MSTPDLTAAPDARPSRLERRWGGLTPHELAITAGSLRLRLMADEKSFRRFRERLESRGSAYRPGVKDDRIHTLRRLLSEIAEYAEPGRMLAGKIARDALREREAGGNNPG